MNKNKKVKNTKAQTYDGINFRSRLETTCYKELISAGFKPKYEEKRFVLMDGFSLDKVIFYTPYRRKYQQYPRKLLHITYTPDFSFEYKGYMVLIDTKGFPNETYPMKKKMFLKKLEEKSLESNLKYIFFEPHNKRQILKTIKIIKSLE